MSKMPNFNKGLHPPRYVLASAIIGLGGLINGMDTSSIGPVTTMESFSTSFGALSPSLHGLVISSVLLSGGLACIVAGRLADTAGRIRAIMLGALAFAVGAALEAAAVSLGMFIAGRLIVGIGEGLMFSVTCAYVCEISPPQHRGILASLPQVCITLGLCVGYFVSYGSVHISNSLSWRLPLALQSGIAMVFALCSFFLLPESPRWLYAKGRREESNAMWDKLGVLAAEREKVEETDTSVLQIDTDVTMSNRSRKPTLREGLNDFLRVFGKDSRRQMALGVFLMLSQQLSGIDGVLYYAPTLFKQAGLSSSQASFLASGVSAIAIAVCTIPATLWVDKWGRRQSTIWGGLAVSSCMLLIGSLYASNSVHATFGAARWVVVVTIYVFAISYAVTWAIGVKIFANEIQPAATRATAISLAQGANFVSNFLVALTTPIFLARSSYGVYFLFGGMSLVTVVVCVLYMPETQGRSLEAIEESFRSHTVIEFPILKALKRLVGKFMGRRTSLEIIRDGQSTEEVELPAMNTRVLVPA